MVLKAIREQRANLELVARIRHLINEAATVTIVHNPQWIELRTSIVQALISYPEAQSAVLSAIAGGSNGSLRDDLTGALERAKIAGLTAICTVIGPPTSSGMLLTEQVFCSSATVPMA